MVCTGDAGKRLEGIAGYQGKAFDAPAYLIILFEKSPYYRVNAGFIGENLLLKLFFIGWGVAGAKSLVVAGAKNYC